MLIGDLLIAVYGIAPSPQPAAIYAEDVLYATIEFAFAKRVDG